MPLAFRSCFTPARLLHNPHLMTAYAAYARPVPHTPYARERMTLPDGDFLDLDWCRSGAARLTVISHGLEGNSHSRYIRGMCAAFARRGWDSVVWHLRGCSGELNRAIGSYHAGSTHDLRAVLNFITSHYHYSAIALIGFSLGGNIVLLHLGTESHALCDAPVIGAAAISPPCDLRGSANALARPEMRFYMKTFLESLGDKLRRKHAIFPDKISLTGFEKIRTFHEYDQRYTAPLHGFEDVDDYWRRSSSLPHIARITTPTLILSARNDPFLSPSCLPEAEARENPYVLLETPSHGGHVGFISALHGKETYADHRIIEFLEALEPPRAYHETRAQGS